MLEKHEKALMLMDDIEGHKLTIIEAQREIKKMERDLIETVLSAGWLECITVNKRRLRSKFARRHQ